jgi:mannosyltransferase
MWRDEQVTFEVSQRSLGQIAALVKRVDLVHALYYTLMHAWMQLHRNSEVWLRVPSVLAMALATGLTVAIGIRLRGLRTGVFAGLLLATIPLASFYAQEGRSYTMVCAAVLFATYSLVRAVDTEHRWWWLSYAFTMTVAGLLHEISVLAFGAQAVTLLVSRVKFRVLLRFVTHVSVSALALAPLVVYSAKQSKQIAWLTPPTLDTVLTFVQQFAGPSLVVVVVTLGFVVVGTISSKSGPGTLNVATVALPLAVIPPTVLLLVSLVHPMYHERYVLFALPAVPLLAGAGLDWVCTQSGLFVARRFHRGALQAFPHALGACVVLAVGLLQYQVHRETRTAESRFENMAAAAHVIATEAKTGDAVVFLTKNYRAVILGYPEAFRTVADITLEKSGIQAKNLRGIEFSASKIGKAMRRAKRIWVIGPPKPPRNSHDGRVITKQATLKAHFVALDSTPIHGISLTLYERKRDFDDEPQL